MPHDQVIAKRTLSLRGHPRGEIVVTLFRPEPDQNDYRCEFEIDGTRGYSMGVDEMQALFLALQHIGTRLYTSAYFKAGKLMWLDQRNLGFPVPDNIADIVPKTEYD